MVVDKNEHWNSPIGQVTTGLFLVCAGVSQHDDLFMGLVLASYGCINVLQGVWRLF